MAWTNTALSTKPTPARKRRPKVCDACLDAAYDEGAGRDIADHCCEAIEEDISCACACRREL